VINKTNWDFGRMRERQKIFAERHKQTLEACHAAIQGKWDEAANLFLKGADDSTAKMMNVST
jgi:hypothetical protein